MGVFCLWRQPRMGTDPKHLEITLETQVESVNLAEEMCLRVAEAAGFGEEDCYKIGMSVREGVINAFHYGNQERPEKKIHLVVDLTGDKMIIHVLDEGHRPNHFRSARSAGRRESSKHLRTGNLSDARIYG
jgi:anti-sigma regulatory factor (Ser/Thr protein kinase)